MQLVPGASLQSEVLKHSCPYSGGKFELGWASPPQEERAQTTREMTMREFMLGAPFKALANAAESPIVGLAVAGGVGPVPLLRRPSSSRDGRPR